MRYIWQHIKKIINEYNGEVPLSHFLKAYFKKYPILGSRDRKLLSTMAYSWYRCGKGLQEGTIEQKIEKCLALCGHTLPAPLMSSNNAAITNISFNSDLLLPGDLNLSEGINKEEWIISLLRQPDLFIRVIKDKDVIIHALTAHDIPFKLLSEQCLALPNGAKIDAILPEDTYAVQDASSQATGKYFKPAAGESWLDCCAGAGGKSLLLKSIQPGIKLTVSDKRESIIHNLKDRFRQYHYDMPATCVTDIADVELMEKTLGGKLFDHIICDAPCSGSGTWARTPEQLYFFDAQSIAKYTALQKQIATNVSTLLRPGGTLYYITCSVFQEENENVASHISQHTKLKIQQQQLINGTDIQADSMFIAVLQNFKENA